MGDPTNQPEPTFGYDKDAAPEPYNPNFAAPQQPVQPPMQPQQPQYPAYGQQPIQQQPQYNQYPPQQPYIQQPQQQAPQYPQMPQQAYAPNQYQPVNPASFAVPPKKSKVGLIIGIIVAAFFVLGTPVFIILMLVMGSIANNVSDSGAAPYDPSTAPYQPDSSLDDDDYAVDSSTTGNGTLEDEWLSGAIWKTPPAPMTPPTAFSSDYADANDWLHSLPGFDPEMQVITTSDTAYNCSGTTGGKFGGCYKLSYGKVIFVWWRADATDDEKKFMVLHEYSHYEQGVRYFDEQMSAIDQGYASNDTLLTTMETDASCRVFYDYGYSQYEYLNDSISAPCTLGSSWYEGYWADQLTSLGVVFEDY